MAQFPRVRRPPLAQVVICAVKFAKRLCWSTKRCVESLLPVALSHREWPWLRRRRSTRCTCRRVQKWPTNEPRLSVARWETAPLALYFALSPACSFLSPGGWQQSAAGCVCSPSWLYLQHAAYQRALASLMMHAAKYQIPSALTQQTQRSYH